MDSCRPERSSAGGKGGEEVDVGEDGERVVEAADEVLAGGEVDAGLAAEGGVDLREDGGGDADVADAAHVDGGEEAGHVADDAAAEGEQDGVAVGTGVGELLGEGLDVGEALVALAGREEEDGGLGVGREGCEECFVPERPDVGRGDDEVRRARPAFNLAQARIKGAEEAGRDGDVVRCLRSGDADGGHGEAMVPRCLRFAHRWLQEVTPKRCLRSDRPGSSQGVRMPDPSA